MQMKRFKIIAAVVMVLALTAMAAGCGASAVTKPQPSGGVMAAKVSGSCTIEVSGDTVTVTGETDIMDGAIIHVSIVSQDGMIVDSVAGPKQGDTVTREFKITGDKFDDSVKSVTGYIACAPTLYGTQPDAVYSAYGKKFENVEAPEGDLVWNSSGVIIVFGSESAELGK